MSEIQAPKSIEDLSEAEFAVLWHRTLMKIEQDPLRNFIRAGSLIDFEPSPAQEVILKIFFNQRLDDTTKKLVYMEKEVNGIMTFIPSYMTDTELYYFMTDQVYEYSDSEDARITKINLIMGRRSGKTLMSAIIAIYVAVTTNWKPYLRKTPFATVLILSHSKEFTEEILEVIRSLIEASPILKRLIHLDKKNTQATMNLRVPFIVDRQVQYSRVQIKAGAASSKTTRGVAAPCVLCDEIAYWGIEESMKETDEKILKAVRPAQNQFGDKAMLLKLSSPGAKNGVLYNEYKRFQDGTLPTSYAVFKAPTWVMNPTIPHKMLTEEYKLDPDAFDTETRANFVDSLSNFIVSEYIDMAVLKGTTFIAPEEGWTYKAAIDAAYKGDAFTFSVVGQKDNRIRQFVAKGWQGSKQAPVKANDVAQYIRGVAKEFGLNEVAADQYSFQPLKEIFEQYGVTLIENNFTPKFKKQIYFNLKKLFHSNQIDILDVDILKKELKQLVVEQSGMGTVKISHPQGGTDDYADALAIAAFLVVEAQGQGSFSFEAAMTNHHGVVTDINGITVNQAPTGEMLGQRYGYQINDNSLMYMLDPETNKLRRSMDMDDDADDGISFSF